MSRLGYIVLLLAIILMGWYVLRPVQDTATKWERVYQGEIPTDYTLRANGLEQQVAGNRLRIGSIELPLGEEKAGGLWNQWQVLSAPADRFVTGIRAADYAAYGIDPQERTLEGQGFALSWGERDGNGYVLDRTNGRLAAVDARTIARLDALADRLDAEAPVPQVVPLAVTVDGERFIRRGNLWASAFDATRPSATARVRSLIGFISALRLDSLVERELSAADPVAHIVIENPVEETVKEGFRAVLDLTVYAASDQDDGGYWQATGWPAQRLSQANVDAARVLAASFREDRLFNLGGGIFGHGITTAVVSRAGSEWFRLGSSTARQLDDLSSRWDVVWADGREYADPQAADRLADALNAISVRHVRPRLAMEPPWPDALRIELTIQGEQNPQVLEMRGREVRSATHVGFAVQLPELIADLNPDRFLDPVIANRVPERVIKLQRRIFDRTPALEETFACDERGVWRRTFPDSGPVDQVVLQRLARALAGGTARAVRQATSADRALAGTREIEIAVRFAPKDSGNANDFTDLEETTMIDIGLALSQRDGVWQALNLGSGIAYELEADFVDLLRIDTASPLVMPIIPALVSSITLTQMDRMDEPLVIQQRRSGWEIIVAGSEKLADAVEVRRLLRDLAHLTALRRIDGTGLMGNEVASTVSVALPGSERELTERILLQIAHPGTLGAGPDECVVFAESTRFGAMVSSRAIIPVAAVRGFVPDAARFQARQ